MTSTIFICTHGRPDKQYTLTALRESGYKGQIVLVVDDEDDKYEEYLSFVCSNEDDNLLLYRFCKQEYIDKVDIGVQKSKAKRAAILYAKCACEDYARRNGLDAFGIADDDFTGYRYRYNEEDQLKSLEIHKTFGKVLDNYFEFILENNICMVSIGTNQMFMGGVLTPEKISNFRIPYTFIFRNAHIKFDWVSELYEDNVSEMLKTWQGYFMMQLPFVQVNLKPLYAGAEGGMTSAYKSVSTISRVFSVIQYLPGCSKIVNTHKSITFSISKDNAFPKLISSKFQLQSK